MNRVYASPAYYRSCGEGRPTFRIAPFYCTTCRFIARWCGSVASNETARGAFAHSSTELERDRADGTRGRLLGIWLVLPDRRGTRRFRGPARFGRRGGGGRWSALW